MKLSEAIVTKVTESGKSIYVGIKVSKYQQQYTFGWTGNPDNLKKGDKLPLDEFKPVGLTPLSNEDGPILHEDGSPVMSFTFA